MIPSASCLRWPAGTVAASTPTTVHSASAKYLMWRHNILIPSASCLRWTVPGWMQTPTQTTSLRLRGRSGYGRHSRRCLRQALFDFVCVLSAMHCNTDDRPAPRPPALGRHTRYAAALQAMRNGRKSFLILSASSLRCWCSRPSHSFDAEFTISNSVPMIAQSAPRVRRGRV